MNIWAPGGSPADVTFPAPRGVAGARHAVLGVGVTGRARDLEAIVGRRRDPGAGGRPGAVLRQVGEVTSRSGRRERAALADAADRGRPGPATLCEGWTTLTWPPTWSSGRAGPTPPAGFSVCPVPAGRPRLAGPRRERRSAAGRTPTWWTASGPARRPGRRGLAAGRAANPAEHFVHHEDVRRAAWPRRRASCPRGRGRALGSRPAHVPPRYRAAAVGVVIVVTEGAAVELSAGPPPVVSRQAGRAAHSCYGRRDHA